MNSMAVDTESMRIYWENYQRSLDGDPLDSSDLFRDHLEEEWSYWADVSGLVLEAVLVFLIIILVGVTFYCLGKKKRNRDEDKELGDPEPPNYEDVMKKDKEELENLKDLPSYLEAINVKKSYVQTV